MPARPHLHSFGEVFSGELRVVLAGAIVDTGNFIYAEDNEEDLDVRC